MMSFLGRHCFCFNEGYKPEQTAIVFYSLHKQWSLSRHRSLNPSLPKLAQLLDIRSDVGQLCSTHFHCIMFTSHLIGESLFEIVIFLNTNPSPTTHSLETCFVCHYAHTADIEFSQHNNAKVRDWKLQLRFQLVRRYKAKQ
jgi:hypothetical protein